jgi:ABC-type nitrate/sulfonate/bicarbonate transport system ATPase subunit
MSAALHFVQVSKTFKREGFEAIEAVAPTTLAVEAEEFVCLLGPSGCGKSTLLNLAAGFERPTSGRVTFDGVEVAGPHHTRGVVFQDGALFPWLTALENVCYGPRIRGSASHKAAGAEMLEAVGLSGFADRYPHELSGGMRQRVAIARALANEPELLLMDEPFGALDAQTRIVMQQLLLDIWQRDRRTVLFITHDIDEAILLGDRVVVMSARPGRIKQELRIELARPRRAGIDTDDDFIAVKRTIASALREERTQILA